MIVIADRCPKAPIHWLVIPHTHIADIRAIATRADEPIFTALLTTARDVVARYADNRPFKFLINNGFEAGQRVFHLHAHILIGPLENSDIAAL